MLNSDVLNTKPQCMLVTMAHSIYYNKIHFVVSHHVNLRCRQREREKLLIFRFNSSLYLQQSRTNNLEGLKRPFIILILISKLYDFRDQGRGRKA